MLYNLYEILNGKSRLVMTDDHKKVKARERQLKVSNRGKTPKRKYKIEAAIKEDVKFKAKPLGGCWNEAQYPKRVK
jgi:hypothetical protein